jgi:hypothetical protein
VPRVQFTNHLKTLFPGLDEVEVPGANVAEVVRALDARYPRLAECLLDDRATLSDAVAGDDTVFVLQALSGG